MHRNKQNHLNNEKPQAQTERPWGGVVKVGVTVDRQPVIGTRH